MPGLNRTGPQGQGPMTGGARGNCNSANVQEARPEAGSMGFGRGMAYGRNFRGGYSRNRGNNYNMSMGGREYVENAGASAEELNMLRDEVAVLNKKIAELEGRL